MTRIYTNGTKTCLLCKIGYTTLNGQRGCYLA